jgi:hypothetical protein
MSQTPSYRPLASVVGTIVGTDHHSSSEDGTVHSEWSVGVKSTRYHLSMSGR